MRVVQIAHAVELERDRQGAKYGFAGTLANPEMPSFVKLSTIVEEVGEVARVLGDVYNDDHHNGPRVKRPTTVDLADELVQVIALAQAWLESLDLSVELVSDIY